jgi:oxygen-independent coproporphyrinogen-3 oxidase
VEEATGLEHQIRRGKYPAPDDDLAADMYELAEEMLDVAGYQHYEISNWARRASAKDSEGLADKEIEASSSLGLADKRTLADSSHLQSRHNLTYWHNEPYLGFGAGAHSCRGGRRFWNVLSPVDYIQRLERGEDVVAGGEEISRELEMSETMILGLRLDEGIAFEAFVKRYGHDPREKYASQIKLVKELGLLDLSDQRMRLTPRGRLLSNEVFWRFLP